MLNQRLCLLIFVVLTFMSAATVRAQAPADGVEVQARGPVHEAYAESVAGTPKASAIVAKEPPKAIEELPPDQKPEGDNVTWMPGYWSFDEERNDFTWISGFWRAPPPNRRWVPGHWKQADGGWQWASGFWGASEQADVTYLPPPPEPVQAAPTVPAPTKNHTYVPGCWIYRDDHYVWRPGFWVECRPNWLWVPAHYVWSPCGYVFVDGYWDYTLKERGVLFAPVVVTAEVYSRPGYVYTPVYVVQDECLVGALFVRPGCRCYYFGDYYEPRYVSAGYTSWCDVRVGVGCGDPLFSYYRWEYRDNPRWEVEVRATYVGRYNGDIARPSRTIVQNNTVVQNVTNVTNVNNTTVNNNTNNITNNVNRTTNNTAISSASMVAPLSQVAAKNPSIKPVSMEARQADRVAAQTLVTASQHRGQTEAKLLSAGPAPTKPTDAPRVAKLDLPKPAPASAIAAAKSPPPSPTRSELRPPPAQAVTPTPAGTATKLPPPSTRPTPSAASPEPGHAAAAPTATLKAPASPATPLATPGTGTKLPPPPGARPAPSATTPAAPSTHPAAPTSATPPVPSRPAVTAPATSPTTPSSPALTRPTPSSMPPTTPAVRPTTPTPTTPAARPTTPAVRPAPPPPARTPPPPRPAPRPDDKDKKQ